jgi:hypothetical protein
MSNNAPSLDEQQRLISNAVAQVHALRSATRDVLDSWATVHHRQSAVNAGDLSEGDELSVRQDMTRKCENVSKTLEELNKSVTSLPERLSVHPFDSPRLISL